LESQSKEFILLQPLLPHPPLPQPEVLLSVEQPPDEQEEQPIFSIEVN
jgi:hypothetical protein